MGSRITRVVGFFLANFQLPKPYRSHLRVRHQARDRQTTAVNALYVLTLWGGDIINIE